MHGVEQELIPRSMEIIAVTTATQLWDELVSTSAKYARVTLAERASNRAYDETSIRVNRLSQNQRMFHVMISSYRMAGQHRVARAMTQLGNSCRHLNTPRNNSVIRDLRMLISKASAAAEEANEEEDRVSSLV